MCLAIPMCITELRPNHMALASHGGVSKEISLALVKGAKEGDIVVVHVGFALSKISQKEAVSTLELMAELSKPRP